MTGRNSRPRTGRTAKDDPTCMPDANYEEAPYLDLDVLIPNACKGFLLNDDGALSASDLRQFIALASKYIVHPKHWTSSGPFPTISRFGISFENHPVIKPMIDSFVAFASEEMNKKSGLNRCLKDLVGFKSGLNRKNCKRLTRHRKVARLRRRSLKIIRGLTNREPGAVKGLRVFLQSVNAHFIRPRKKASEY